ncbi:GMC oxidoreductase [Rhypophila decipiens]
MRSLFLGLATLATCFTPAAIAERVPRNVIRSTSQLRPNYDFIILGGGTSGLTVGDRLSEAFPAKTVLVVEYGDIEYAPGSFDPPVNWQQSGASVSRWAFNSLPNPAMNNKTAFVAQGQVVGGSSAANGQFFDRGSRHDYDAWAEVGGDEFRKWNWNGIYPFFKKSVTFHEPPPSLVKQHGYTWDVAAYGGTTPIHSSFPPFQWADTWVLREVWQEMGIKIAKECAGGNKQGICWVPTSQHPVTARRSHSGLGHYADVIAARSNYDLLVRYQAIRVVYPKGLKSGSPIAQVRPVPSFSSSDVFNLTARAEIIISAGAFHTPTILQRSGIGPANFLRSAGIPVLLDLPGIGSNLQDHTGGGIRWNYTKPYSAFPIPSDLANNATFKADSIAGFNETPARGPYTLALGNEAIYVSLPRMTSKSTLSALLHKMHQQAASLASTAVILPPGPDYGSNPSMLAGYKSQLLTLAAQFAKPDSPTMETPFATSSDGSRLAFLLHPLSRGTVRLNLTDPLSQPIIDYRHGSNPLDFDLHISHIRYLRGVFDTPTFTKYGAVETGPGKQVADSDVLLKEYIKQEIILSFQHPCCTAAMLPKHKGGVVGPDLKVHGTRGLRVADISIMPLIVGSHTSATAYAIGEKAADLIIREWKGR